MTILDIKTAALDGLNLIEASAGTGKTYTLAELYVRLIVEKELTVNQILVVTYTRAATEELRDRLREKLVAVRTEYLVAADEDKTAFHRINLAIQSFDQAAIFTIHGFCQRILTDYAFESGLGFELELIGDDKQLLQAATDDFWRRQVMTETNADFIRYLVSQKESPEGLLNTIKSCLFKPYLSLLPVENTDLVARHAQAVEQFDRLKKCWQQESEWVSACLNNKSLLDGNKYRTKSIEKWLVSLAELMQRSCLPDTVFKDFDRFTPGRLEKALKKDQQLPELQFWREAEQFLDNINFLQQAYKLKHQQLRVDLLAYLNEVLPEQKQQQQLLSYDDLLLNLEQALKGDNGDWLVEKIRNQYQAALIDEFQDTDPIQFASFSRIYVDSGLPIFLVGDPKQAIYSFRGADIFTYLKAKSITELERQYTLAVNWRSHPQLVSAVNTLFSRQTNPFNYQAIPFHNVGSGREETAIFNSDEEDKSCFQLHWLDLPSSSTKAAFTQLAAQTTANEIASLLTQSEAGSAFLYDEDRQGNRAITGADLAVLVRNHRQAGVIQNCLQQRGINSVIQSQQSIFVTEEALMMERLLLALAEPIDESRLKAALATPFWGMSADEIYQLQHDEHAWLTLIEFAYALHRLWQKSGFMAVFKSLLTRLRVQQRLLSLPSGERQLTNLLHLAELIQVQHLQQQQSLDQTIAWLAQQRIAADHSDDEMQLRLESDQKLVKIITIHKSKGLEYPIVFCPFLWDVNLTTRQDDVIRFHSEEEEHQACVAFSEPYLSEAKSSVKQEEQAENSRLLYVALTRARERCVVLWGNVKGIKDSSLFPLLHPELAEANSDEMYSQLVELSEQSQGTISVKMSSETAAVYPVGQQDKPKLLARQFKGNIKPIWKIGSFSGLTRGHHVELPDYDAINTTLSLPIAEQTVSLNRFSFPRGTQAGTCLHTLFELWDFSSNDNIALDNLVNSTLLNYGFDNKKWSKIVGQWLTEVCSTPLDDHGFQLSQLTKDKRLDELAFYFPVTNLSTERLKQAVLPFLEPSSALMRVIENLSFSRLTGFMKGFIDLVFEHQGRYFIIDYKSNYLGQSQQDYQQDKLTDAMVEHDYSLQYLIYSLALHRYLKLRLPDYDPEQHLGGIYYLFIRGMNKDWPMAGVYYDRPSASLLASLDRCFQGGSDE